MGEMIAEVGEKWEDNWGEIGRMRGDENERVGNGWADSVGAGGGGAGVGWQGAEGEAGGEGSASGQSSTADDFDPLWGLPDGVE